MEFKTEKFIDLVEERPDIWRVGQKSNRDRVCRQKLFTEISSYFADTDIDGAACAKKWKSLKDQYLREKRTNMEHIRKSGGAGIKKKKWMWFDRPSFLDDAVMDVTASESNVEELLQSQQPKSPTVVFSEDMSQAWIEEVPDDVPELFTNEQANDTSSDHHASVSATALSARSSPQPSSSTVWERVRKPECDTGKQRANLIQRAQVEAKKLRQEDTAKAVARKRSRDMDDAELEKSIGTALVSLAKDEEPESKFLNSFAASLKKLTDEKKAKVKLAITKIFFMADMGSFDHDVFRI